MASVSSLGSGSGIDLEGLLTKLMTAEQTPLKALATKVTSTNTRISSLGTLNSALEALQTAAAAMKTSINQTAVSKFSSYSASVADTTLATASTTTGASAGSYKLSNITLATAQQIRKSGISVPSVAGSLSIQVGAGKAVDVAISANSELSDVATAINSSGAGVTASIVTSGTTKYLSLTANDTGSANTISVTGSDTGGGSAWATAFDYSAASWTGNSDGTVPVPTSAGTLSIALGTGSAVNVTIGANASLTDVVGAINGANTGVTASIATNGTTSYLKLTANTTGAAVTVSGSGTDWSAYATAGAGNANANSWTQQAAAGNASVTVDDVVISSASNTLTTAISGVTLNLLKASTTGTTLTVAKDTTSSLTSALKAFVTAYNSANTTMGGLSAYNATTKVAGALKGDSTLRTAQTQIRALLFSTSTGGTSAYQRLSDIGVSVAKDGSLSLDSTKLNKAISADFTTVASLVAKVGEAYNTSLSTIAGSKGTIAAAQTNANGTIKSLNTRQTAVSARLVSIEAIYRKQFTALDTLVAKMKSTSSYLTQQFATKTSS